MIECFKHLEPELPSVSRPARYIGGEYNAIRKTDGRPRTGLALCFPDVYEVGMSHLGLAILYDIVNRREDFVCERCFCPWPDMEAVYRRQQVLLGTLESKQPLRNFDVVGFSLQYELSYTNVLAMLDLAGICRHAAQRQQGPLIIAGGPCCVNPEPLSPFIDAFLIGEAEEAIIEILDCVARFGGGSACGAERASMLAALAALDGVYVPRYYSAATADKSAVAEHPAAPAIIRRRVVRDFAGAPVPVAPVVPFVEAVHERITIEIMRGCPNRCYFCQAGFSITPVRYRSVARVAELVAQTYRHTGYDSVAFCSLSSANYPWLAELLQQVAPLCRQHRLSVALPSLRVSAQLRGLATLLAGAGKSGLTFAPEAGSERLRRLLNKPIDMEHLRVAAREAFAAGWRRVKLYFMIGLPTETSVDLQAIVDLVQELSALRPRRRSGDPAISVSIANFIPKPHTPFQWLPMATPEELTQKQRWLRERISRRVADVAFHDIAMSFLEAYFSRGDRSAALVVEQAFKAGARFDGWSSEFKPVLWQQAWKEQGIDPAATVTASRSLDHALPWQHIQCGVSHHTLKTLLHRTGLGQ